MIVLVVVVVAGVVVVIVVVVVVVVDFGKKASMDGLLVLMHFVYHYSKSKTLEILFHYLLWVQRYQNNAFSQ